MYAGRAHLFVGGRRMEDRLKEAIEHALRSGDDPNTRIRTLIGNDAFNLLDKPWKSIAITILRKEEPVNPDEEVKVKVTRRRGGRRRGVKGSSGIEDSLPSPSQVISGNFIPAFKLATLLIHKGKDPKNWESKLDLDIDQLRNDCISGIHPVWSIAARECPLIAQLGAFPSLEVEIQSVEVDQSWIVASRIDPMDISSLGDLLEKFPTLNLGSAGILKIQRLSKGLQGKKMRMNQIQKSIPEELLSSTIPEHMLLGAYLLIAAGELEKSLKVLQSIKSKNKILMKSVNDVIALTTLRSGDISSWDHCSEVTGKDPLSIVMLLEAWKNPPIDRQIDSKKIESGMMHLELHGEPVSDTLRWMLVKQVAETGDLAAATELVLETRIDDEESFIQASSLAGDNELLITRLVEKAPEFSLITWSEIVTDSKYPMLIRLTCSKLIANERTLLPSDVLESTIEILSTQVDIFSLSLILYSSKIDGSTKPYSVLLCSALAPANIGEETIQWLQNERSIAHDSIISSDIPEFLSIHEAALIRLLDGGNANLDELLGRLPESGSEVLRETRRALMDGGDGLVSEKRIDTLEESIAAANLSSLESSLFHAIVNLLRMNRVNNEIQMSDSSRKEHASELLNQIIENNFSAIFLNQVQQMLLEHEVASENFVSWLQENRPGSEWSPVANAAIKVNMERYREAARLYKQAAPRFQAEPHCDFEIATQLYRKSLIGFAQAQGWSEAIALLNSHEELATTITSRFKLYLQVSHSAEVQQQNRGKRNSKNRDMSRKAIFDFVDEKVPNISSEEEESTYSSQRERNRRKEDLIESLMTYPSKRNLPEEPFVGRVRAALNHIREKNKSGRTRIENRFREAIKDEEEPLELFSIANEIASEDPVRALGMLEHAVSVCNYLGRMEKARLIASMKTLYSKHESNIPIRSRRILSSVDLAPLVVIDTNLLIDALSDAILRKMAMDRNGIINPNSSLLFHHTLRHLRLERRIRTYVPLTAKHELMNKIGNIETGKFDPERTLSVFSGSNQHINLDAYREAITPDILEKMHHEILQSFHDWEPSSSEFLEAVEGEMNAVESFIQSHSEIYRRVTDFKDQRGAADKRTEFNGDSIYPESGDLDIMRTATYLASSIYPNIGSVIVATRDSDFTLLARALEETLGVGVAKNASELAQWL